MFRLQNIYVTFLVGAAFLRAVACFEPFVFKFGEDKGDLVYTSEGTILPFVFLTEKHIEIPDGMDVSYVQVKVYSISPPKVDYDRTTRTIAIKFSLTQVTMAKFEVLVKAVPAPGAAVSRHLLFAEPLA